MQIERVHNLPMSFCRYKKSVDGKNNEAKIQTKNSTQYHLCYTIAPVRNIQPHLTSMTMFTSSLVTDTIHPFIDIIILSLAEEDRHMPIESYQHYLYFSCQSSLYFQHI